MSIEKRITEAFEKIIENDPEAALFQICAAIEKTAKNEDLAKGREGFKKFISNNIPIIASVGGGSPVQGISIVCSHLDLPNTKDNVYSLEDIVYHLLRCGLYHSAEIPEKIIITDKRLGTDNRGTIFIPQNFVVGLIIAVIASPANINGQIDENFYIILKNKKFTLNNIWGKRDEINSELIELYAL